MLHSMTGYGEASFEDDHLRVGFRVKSVNNRGLDAHLKLPFDFMYLEPILRHRLKEAFHRGRMDVYTEIEIRDAEIMPPSPVNKVRLNQLLTLADQLRSMALIKGDLDINTLVRLPDLTLNQRVGFRLPEVFDQKILAVFDEVIDALAQSRQREGEALHDFFMATFEKLAETVDTLEEVSIRRRENLRDQIIKRIDTLAADVTLDPQRLAQEVVYHADRQDISEEVLRLRTHIQASRDLVMTGKRPIGKELEFLVQEQFREVTTIGNKAKHQEIAEHVVQLKTTYEQIREQVLNVE